MAFVGDIYDPPPRALFRLEMTSTRRVEKPAQSLLHDAVGSPSIFQFRPKTDHPPGNRAGDYAQLQI